MLVSYPIRFDRAIFSSERKDKMNSTENTNKNLITALYCRLSQEDERLGESLSIENQRLMLKKYAEEHCFPNIQFYVDDGFSGADFNRPDFKRMMNDVECGKVGIVIVKDQSRLGRDYLQTGMLMEITFPQYDVRFIAINDGVDSENGVSDFSGIKNYFNDFYARDTSRKIRAVQRAKGERGERVGTTIPYGYMKNPDNPKQLMPNSETAPVVKRIFEMYASGIGVVKICDTLSKEKILSPSVYAFKATGSRAGNPDLTRPYHWGQTTVRRMLSNQEYAGDTINFKTYSKSNKLKKRLKNNPENILIFKNTHEAIIDRKTFEMVQKHFEGRKRPDKQGEMDKYTGYLFCGECGSRLYLHRGKTIKPENNAFQCGGFQGRTTDCTAHYIRESVLDKIVLHNLKMVTAFARDNPDEFYAMATQSGEAEAKRFYQASEREKAQLENLIRELDNIIRCLYEDRVCGRLTPERYDSMANRYEQEQTELRQKLKSITEQINKMDMRENCIQEFISKAKEYIEMPKLTLELLRVFIRRIEVYEKPEKYSRTCGNPIMIHYAFQLPEQNGMPAIEVLVQHTAKTA